MFRFVRNTLAIIGLALIVYHICFDVQIMTSNSMSPTLRGNGGAGSDRVLVDKVTYRFRRPRRWELVQFISQEGILVTKRVVGLPGEKVSIREHEVAIDGEVIARPGSLGFLRYYAYGDLRGGKAVECGEGYFVLGDDSKDSSDSRYEGPIARKRILGRAWAIVGPAGRRRVLTP